MLDKLKALLKDGIDVPLMKDDGKPSIIFTFAYTTFILAVIAEIYFMIKGDPLAATATGIIFWAIAVVFLRIGKLDKVKFDLDDKSIDLESSEDKKDEQK